MNITDLGVLEGPILLFGGPYSNLQATEALLAQARARNIPPDRMICTGDVVAYCADPADTLRAIRASGCVVVAGNCEKQLAEGAEDCGCGFDEASQCSILSHGWYAHALASVGKDDRAWMAALPDMITFCHNGRRCAIIHGGVSDISRFLWPTSPDAAFADEIALISELAGPVDIVIAGHCGIPFIRNIGGTLWINAGAIGMPPNDGSPQTRYVVLGDVPEIHRLDYDYAAAQIAMRAAGLAQGYDTALATGLWPSEDTLPPEMRR